MNKEIKDIKQEQILSILLLFWIYNDIQKGTTKSWKYLHNSENEIKDNTILSIICKLKQECQVIIKPNQKFYRARAYKNSEIKNLYNNPVWFELINDFKVNIPEIAELNIPLDNIEEFFDFIPFFKNFYACKSILNSWIKKNKCEKFWGFSAKESGRNYSSKKEGRLNKENEHHLYLSYDINTAISEVRPINKQLISVATIKIKKELKIFDLTKTFEIGDGTNGCDYMAFYQIAEMFSIPNFNDNDYYKPTQNISSYIKQLGFDGIVYASALNEKGKNILIFEFNDSSLDNEYFDILGTDVYEVSNEIKKNKVLPFENNEIGL